MPTSLETLSFLLLLTRFNPLAKSFAEVIVGGGRNPLCWRWWMSTLQEVAMVALLVAMTLRGVAWRQLQELVAMMKEGSATTSFTST